jgi:hypothetical protein
MQWGVCVVPGSRSTLIYDILASTTRAEHASALQWCLLWPCTCMFRHCHNQQHDSAAGRYEDIGCGSGNDGDDHRKTFLKIRV